MTDLPGNRIPNEALPTGGTSTPAEDAQFPPVWCWHPETGGDSDPVSWSWVGDQGGWLCDDPQHFMAEPAPTVGDIDPAHLPVYGHPPNDKQRAALYAAYVAAVAEEVREQELGPWWSLGL